MTMNIFFKASALALYVLAVASAFVTLPFAYTSALQNGAAILLGLHVLELLIFFKFVKRYPGQLVDSMALTLLFGFLHWLPLAKGTRT